MVPKKGEYPPTFPGKGKVIPVVKPSFTVVVVKGEVKEYTGASLPTCAKEALNFPKESTLLFCRLFNSVNTHPKFTDG